MYVDGYQIVPSGGRPASFISLVTLHDIANAELLRNTIEIEIKVNNCQNFFRYMVYSLELLHC